MNPLLSFWAKVQPGISGSFGSQTWRAISQSTALAPSTGDDTMVSRSATTYSWAFDYFKSTTSRLASHVYWDVFYWASSGSWALNGMVARMQQDVHPILKPSKKAVALCEGFQRYTTRNHVHTSSVRNARSITSSSSSSATNNKRGGKEGTSSALQASQQILQHQDYINYQIPPPPLRRRNSKEWVPQYKKERIDKINYNNVFGGISDVGNNEIPVLAAPAAEDVHVSANTFARVQQQPESVKSSKQVDFHPISPTSSTISTGAGSVESLSLSQTNPTPSVAVAAAVPSSSISSRAREPPSTNDVICGRGGKANTHSGNINFRAEAQKLRSWYESSSKSEKFTISSYLVDLVREKGGRFLKRNPDKPGSWSEADANDVRKKASQALREGRKQQHKQ